MREHPNEPRLGSFIQRVMTRSSASPTAITPPIRAQSIHVVTEAARLRGVGGESSAGPAGCCGGLEAAALLALALAAVARGRVLHVTQLRASKGCGARPPPLT